MRIITLILIAVWGVSLLDCGAVQSYKPITVDPVMESWRWRIVEELDGLNVRAMDEAPDGSVWFGNVGSIANYDGLNVKTIPFSDALLKRIGGEKTKAQCTSLVVLHDGTPLFAVNGSVVCRTGEKWRVVLLKPDKSRIGLKLIRALDDTPWLLTRHTLRRFDENLSDSDIVLETHKDSQLITLCQDQQETLWVLEQQKRPVLLRIPLKDGLPIKKSAWRSYPMPFVKETNRASLTVGQDGTIWYIDDIEGADLHGFDPKREVWKPKHITGCKHHYSLLADRTGTLWVGGRDNLFALRGRQGTLYSNEKGLPKTRLDGLMETKDHRLWMHDRSGRVYTVELGDQRWITYKGLHFQCDTSAGTQWFLTGNYRVVANQAGRWSQYSAEDGIIDRPSKITTSCNGLVWVTGNHGDGAAFAVFDGTQWKRYYLPDFAREIGSRAVLEASDGTMWFGAVGGQSDGPRSGGTLQYEVTEDGIIQQRKLHIQSPYRIEKLAQTSDGAIWLGEIGVYRYNQESQECEQLSNLPKRFVTDMAVTTDGTLWISLSGLGIYQKTPKGWQQHTKENGLGSDMIHDLLPLQDGTLLAASDQGVSRFDGQTWTKRILPETFSIAEQGGSLRQDREGAIWINITEQEVRASDITKNAPFCTIRVARDLNQPETRITYFIDQVPYPGNSHITWTAKDRWTDTIAEDLVFSWRIDAGAWSPFMADTEKTFIELDRGSHSFEVRARDLDFNVDSTPACIAFTVIPPVWRQSWFVVMVTLFISLVAGLLWLLIRSREQHLLERQADREQHWVEMDQLKTGFFTNISHELRTPLTVILGPLEVMLATEQNEKRKRTLAMMVRNAKRVETLITQLLDYRKIEQGNIQIESTEGNIADHIQTIVEQLEPLAKRNQIQLSFSGEANGWFDPDKLEKIATNLISNAIKYTAVGGEVVVRVEVNNDLVLTVEDTGAGIEPKHLERIFDRFYRIPEAELVDGSGIGLNLTKELVDLWGGEIHVESPIHESPDRPGTRFTVQLPIHRPAETPDVELQSDSERQTSDIPSVLIVEDDADIRSFLSGGLENRFRIETANDGAKGLERAQTLMPDLIVTDLMMPVMDGIELCRALKTNEITSHIPIIMLTAKSSLAHQIEGLSTGADDYITKPFHMVLLQSRIQNLLDSRRMLRAQFTRHYMLPDQPLPADTLDQTFLLKVFSILEEEASDPDFTVETLAKTLHMSLSTLRRKLKAVTNETPARLIWDIRLKKGAKLLTTTNLTITEIAFSVGYVESNHFGRQFKQRYNKTPSQYRSEADPVEPPA